MKVAIVGGSPSSQHLAPYNDKNWEIWVHGNQLDRHESRRVTRIFEIHDDLTEHDEKYPQWLVDKGIPLVVGKKFPIQADHVSVFPDESDVLGKLSSTPAYMMAYAINEIEFRGERENEIAIYGVDMGVDDHEYFKQRPAMYAWIGYAKGKGIEVTVASSLFVDKYKEGRDWGKKTSGPFTEASFLEMAATHQQKIDEYTKLIQTHDGCLQSYNHLAKVARGVESGQTFSNLTDSLVIKR